MRNQKGFTFLELLIVIAIIGVIAAIAIPSYLHGKVNRYTEPFSSHYRLDLAVFAKLDVPPDRWLDEDQKSIIRPLVVHRLAELCATPESRTPPVLTRPPATDAFEVAERLQTLQRERTNLATDIPSPERCRQAREAAAVFGLLPAEAR